MKQHTLDYSSNIQLHGIVIIGGILFILLFALKYSHAQIEPGDFEFEGENRTYDVYLPNNYSGTVDFPLLICLHPYGWDGQQGMEYTNFNQVADTSDFLVVYPDAIPNWNSGIGDNPSWPAPNVNDVGFINALIDTINFHYSINLEKVYVCGFSNGGFMAYKLACELSYRFAAIASVSGVISMTTASNCEPSNTMPVLQIHGTADAVVPINGGATGWYSVDETLNIWIDFNNCLEVDTILLPDIDPTDGCTVEKISYTSCTDNSNIVYYKVINGGHTWPGAGPSGQPLGNTNQDINASVEIWNFFKDYPPGPCLPEGITFTTQAEIDNFQTNYPNCTEIEGYVTILGDDITNLNGLNALTAIGGDLTIGDYDTYPYLGVNDSLTSLTGLENLTSIGGWFFLMSNSALSTLTGLENLISIGVGFYVINNYALTGFTGLDNLSSIGLRLEIEGNLVITSLNGFGSLSYIGGGLSIMGNTNLTSLSGMEDITYLMGDLTILAEISLTSLTGLENITSIGGDLTINANNALLSLTGLHNVTSIGGDLRIVENTMLTSLTELDNINPSSNSNLYIYDNDSLSNCDAQSICEYLASPTGTIEIHDNASGCDSQAEVQADCDSITFVVEIQSDKIFTISPNPIESTSMIQYNLKTNSRVSIKILDLSGREVEILANEVHQAGVQEITFNSEALKPGIYFCVLKTNNGVQTKKIIKLD